MSRKKISPISNLKILLSVLIFLVIAINVAQAQKFAFVDSDYILNKMPEYASTQKELNKSSEQWEKELELKVTEIEKLSKVLQAESVLLTDEMKKKRMADIAKKEEEMQEFQKSKFGVDGELYKKRVDLVKPLQDKIYSAVKQVADKGGLMIIFDKASDISMLYANPKLDKSEEVLKALGVKK